MDGFDPSEVSSLEELNSKLQNYVNMRNNAVNRNIGCTPMERYRRGFNEIRFPESREWLDECFMNRVVRKVYNDSTISIDNISYDVPMHFIGDKVEIRFLPDRMEEAYIFYESMGETSNRYPIRKTNRVENSRTKRATCFNLLAPPLTPAIDYSKGALPPLASSKEVLPPLPYLPGAALSTSLVGAAPLSASPAEDF